jgi:hypothetical protein
MYPRSSKLAFNLARSEERAGDFAGAIEHYRLYLSLDTAATDRAEVEALLPTLQERLEATWTPVALVSHPAGARVVIDGKRDARTPVRLRLPPGPHTLHFEADGHRAVDKALELTGAPAALEVTLEKVEAAPAPKPVVVAPVPPPAASPEWRTWAGIGALGAGAVGVGLGVVFHLQSSDTADRAGSVRPGPDGDRRYRSLQDDFDRQRLEMGVAYGVGGALLITGAALLLWPDDPPAQTGALTVRF